LKASNTGLGFLALYDYAICIAPSNAFAEREGRRGNLIRTHLRSKMKLPLLNACLFMSMNTVLLDDAVESHVPILVKLMLNDLNFADAIKTSKYYTAVKDGQFQPTIPKKGTKGYNENMREEKRHHALSSMFEKPPNIGHRTQQPIKRNKNLSTCTTLQQQTSTNEEKEDFKSDVEIADTENFSHLDLVTETDCDSDWSSVEPPEAIYTQWDCAICGLTNDDTFGVTDRCYGITCQQARQESILPKSMPHVIKDVEYIEKDMKCHRNIQNQCWMETVLELIFRVMQRSSYVRNVFEIKLKMSNYPISNCLGRCMSYRWKHPENSNTIDQIQHKFATAIYAEKPELYHRDYDPDQFLSILAEEESEWKNLVGLSQKNIQHGCTQHCNIIERDLEYQSQIIIYNLGEQETDLQLLVNNALDTQERQITCVNTNCKSYKNQALEAVSVETSSWCKFNPIQFVCLVRGDIPNSDKVTVPKLLMINDEDYQIVGKVLATSDSGSHFTCMFEKNNKTYFAESKKRTIVQVVDNALCVSLKKTCIFMYAKKDILDELDVNSHDSD
jgi:hypothetical protein